MSNGTNVGLTVVGSSMAAAPGIVDIPFYESDFWLGAIAITGFLVLLATGIKVTLDIKDRLKWDGQDRREMKR